MSAAAGVATSKRKSLVCSICQSTFFGQVTLQEYKKNDHSQEQEQDTSWS
jgi:hypothetical protein